MIDTINGKAYQFHFDGQCIGDPESSPPGVGSVHMVGKGSALM